MRMEVATALLAMLVIAVAHVCCTGANQTALYYSDYQSESNVPTWRYTCVPDEGCVRVALSWGRQVATLTSPYHESLDVCRATCGRFGGVWPRPATAALSSQTVMFHPNFLRFNMNFVPNEARPLLVLMTEALTRSLLDECSGDVTTVVETPVIVHLNVKSDDVTLSWETDESYILDLQAKPEEIIAHIRSQTIFGLRHGLETFSQLVAANRTLTRQHQQCGLHILAGAKIKDKPVYPHRGVMLDTSRNFIPVENIRRTLDGMGASKMNVLHWHATDSHSFPLESTRVPLLTKYGAYSSSEIYTVKDIEGLLEYARVRGVRVVLEIDSPAHAGNGWQWGKDYGMGELAVCVNAQPWRALCVQPPCGQLNPANPHMYRVLRDLYADVIDLWPKGELFHMGGDEVCMSCWNSTEEIVTYMESQGLKQDADGFLRLWSDFHRKILDIWDEENEAAGVSERLPVMVWSSVLTQAARIRDFLDKERYVIEVWEPVASSLLYKLLALGYRVVSAPKDIWYLDHGFWGSTKYSNWRKMYAHRLPSDPKVLGGEVAMWSEYVDGTDLDARIWPRAAAVAERLWSDPGSAYGAGGTGDAGTAGDAEPRMQRHRARLLARGLRADALSPQWCTEHDKLCM